MPEPFTAGVVFAASLGLLLVRPRYVPEWSAALGGALLLLALGVWTPRQALSQLAASADVLLFFAGLGLTAATADRAGLFRAAAHFAVAAARGSQQRLLVGLFLAGVLVTAVLSNDATALLLTPVAFAAATRLGLSPRPFVFTCALVANAGSFLLPVSNPANLLILSRAPLSLAAFVARLLVPSALALASTLVGLLLVFREDLRPCMAQSAESGPMLTFRSRVNLAGVVALGIAYVLAAAAGWPLGRVAISGAAGLVALDAAAAGWHPKHVVGDIPWTLLALVVGLLLLVGGADQVGLFAPLVGAIDSVSRTGSGLVLPGLVIGMAVLANLINNLPAALVAATAVGSLSAGGERSNLVAAVIVGVNLGPNLTTIGSLATMLWLVTLRRRGLDVSALEYVRVGGLVTVPALVLASAAVWAIGGLAGRGP